MKNVKSHWQPILWTIIILVLCLMPKSAEPPPFWITLIPYFDKVVHLGLYTVLAFLWYHSYKLKHSKLFFVLILIYCFILGGAIELIQPYVGRTKEMMDLVADLLGSVLGIGCFYLILNLKKIRS